MELRSFGAATRPRDRDRVFPCAALGAAVILFACNAFFVGAARARAPWSAALPALATSPAPTPLTNAELVPTVPARSFVPTSEHNASSTLPPIPQPSVAPSRAPSTLAPSTAARANSSRTNPLEIEALLNATIGGVVNCAVRHGLCDVSSCTRNDDGVTASCGCTERPASSTATIALGWPSAVLAEHDEYLAALRDDDDDGDDSFHGLCAALENGTIWPNAAFTSLWSPNPYFHDDALLSTQVACGEVWGANCMGAPCYRVAYNSTPAVFNITCEPRGRALLREARARCLTHVVSPIVCIQASAPSSSSIRSTCTTCRRTRAARRGPTLRARP